MATDAGFVLDDITATLAGPDTSFTVCTNGRDVTRVVKNRTPDIAILDYALPKRNGLALAQALKRQNPRLEVILFTLAAAGALAGTPRATTRGSTE